MWYNAYLFKNKYAACVQSANFNGFGTFETVESIKRDTEYYEKYDQMMINDLYLLSHHQYTLEYHETVPWKMCGSGFLVIFYSFPIIHASAE